MIYREWNVGGADEQTAATLARETGYGLLLCRVLAARGMAAPEQAAALLSDSPLPDPFLMRDMDSAVKRIAKAVQAEEPIAVFGDYDVDGITATALLYTYLESIGAQVFYKLPSRSDEDYGLSPALVDAMADRGISLIVTVDNGTTAFEAAARAKERGVALVITDHHLPGDTLPEAHALVNPCRTDDESGLGMLSGAGVAFMLLAAMEGCPADEMLPEYGDLAAIGTVADVMKLVGPNRTLVKAGLAALRDTHRPGLAALIDACGFGDKDITAESVSYGMAPRLNAAGRMDDATAALHLLLAEDEDEALAIVESLQQQNAARQKAEQEILDVIFAQLDADPALRRHRVLVLWGDNWHPGVIGIVASRLVDRLHKPAIVISFEDGEGKGSGRSTGGFSLYGAIAACHPLLTRYGGHDLAAGFSLRRENAEAFRQEVNAWAERQSPVPVLPQVHADVCVPLADLSVDAVRELERLAPCGSGNPAPRFLLDGVQIDAVYPLSEGKHTRLRFTKGGAGLYAVLFGTAPGRLAYQPGSAVDVLVALSVYDGKQGPQLSARVLEMRPAALSNRHVALCAQYEDLAAGRLPAGEQSAQMLPTRDDIAGLYRLLRGGTAVQENDLRPLFARLGEENTGRVLVGLAALEELGLIEKEAPGGLYRVADVQGKRDLAQSTLLRRLQANEKEVT